MLFSSITFIYFFLPVVLLFYFVILRKSRLLQNIFLLIASLIFYAWGEPKFVIIMIVSIFMNWLFGLLVDRYRGKTGLAKAIVAADVVLNLALLFVFKYLGFTVNSINAVFGLSVSIPSIALPIGISFFTFQAMSYVIDVYRQRGEVQKNILYVGLYISFFPQLIAGPIVRYETVAEEILHRKETADDFFNGFARFCAGMCKKVLLANSFAIVADKAFNGIGSGDTLSVLFAWLGAAAYTLQIFFDFSGYSDMAIGLGRMFGFHFLENFNYPYISTSISEFWRRWHMSLGTWFKDYVYFPLGGSRVSRARNIFNLFVVWSLTGIWHGANVTFIIWGLMFFVLLTFEKMTGFEKKGNTHLYIKALKWLYCAFFIVIGWVVFRSDDWGSFVLYIKSMFGFNHNPFCDGMFIGYFKQNLILLCIGGVLCTPAFKKIKEKSVGKPVLEIAYSVVLAVLFVVSVANLVSSDYNPFIYFNF